ncbi:hypothetical protein G7046_g4603 [Stylonectria norvegica]|nr:hypothetical protein G7046_g4603 [Stylonectria norvegica]
MATDDESASSNDGDDPTVIAMKAQKRLMQASSKSHTRMKQRTELKLVQLKRDRDERVATVIAEADTALESLRTRVAQYQKERSKKRATLCAAHVASLIKAAERKMNIEAKMEELMMEVHLKVGEVEDMMKMGYRGRERDLKEAYRKRES